MSEVRRAPWWRRPRGIIGLGALALLVLFALAALLTPWPAALVIRALFEKNARETVTEMDQYAPTSGLDARIGERYGSGSSETFDWFSPSGGSGPLPTVVWIHGGAWISGSAANVDPYVRILASRGFTGVSLDYSVSPGAQYPTALEQLNAALGYLVDHASEYRIDPDRLVLAGDSAGANLASQLAVLATSPSYAAEVGITPALAPQRLRGIILDCGIYDVSGIPNAPGIGGWGFRIALWSYLGKRDWSSTAGEGQMSTLDHVTGDFPTTWISGGNTDPLTPSQSEPLAARLAALGVDTTTVFYPADHQPELGHEYQFHLDGADARAALTSTVDFLRRVTR